MATLVPLIEPDSDSADLRLSMGKDGGLIRRVDFRER